MSFEIKNHRWQILLTVVLLFLLGIGPVYGQEQVKIKLKSGTYLKGNILHALDSTGVRLMINNQPAFFPYDYIRTIRINQNIPDTVWKDYSFPQFDQGFYHSGGFGLSFSNAAAGFSMMMINGYRFTPLLHAGLGVGYDRYDDIATVPLFLDLKGYLKEGRFVPFFFLRPGYGFLVETDMDFDPPDLSTSGGISWQLGVGYQLNFLESAIAFSLAHVGQNATVSYTEFQWWQGDTSNITEKRMKRRIAFKIELVF